MSYMLYADIDTLLYVTIANNLVNNDTDSPRRHIIDNASSSTGTTMSGVAETSQRKHTHGNTCGAYPFVGQR